MLSISTIKFNDCYTKQLKSPINSEDYLNLINDFKFLCKCAKCDSDFIKYFPQLTQIILQINEDTLVDFFQNKMIAINIYLSIRKKSNDEVLGFIKFYSDTFNCNFLEFFIIEEYRRKGIVKNILSILMGKLKNKTSKIMASVDKENIISQTLLQKMSFQKTHESLNIIYYTYNYV